MKRFFKLLFICIMMVAVLCSCKKGKDTTVNTKLDTDKQVNLTVCGPWSECIAIENAAQKFNEMYPNCSIEYEYVQGYEESISKRLKDSPDTLDLFLSSSIQADSQYYPYALDLFSKEDIDLSNANVALIHNATLKGTEENPEIYCIPLGGELRGLYVNKTLLASLNLEVPANYTELLKCCETLKEAGYVPLNGNPGNFGQTLLYPYICNSIVNSDNYEEKYDQIANPQDGVSELFRQPMEVMYTLMSNYYYNYKYVETELNMFTDMSNEAVSRDFFNIKADGDAYKKVDDVGTVAFMTGLLSQQNVMEKTKEDYHSNIEYEFVLSPVTDKGGFAYVSPAHGIAINKNSNNIDWACEFLNLLFEDEENQQFAKDINYIPNTKNSFAVIKEMFNVPDNQISDLGKMTFNYDFYTIINEALLETSKGNNPKYMDVDKEGNTTLFDFSYYMNNLENAFKQQTESGGQ